MGNVLRKFGEWLASEFAFSAFQSTQRFAMLGALVAYFLAMYAVFIAAIVAVVSFAPVTPGGLVGLGLAALPGNIFQCMSAIGAAHVAAQIFLIKSKIIKMAGE